MKFAQLLKIHGFISTHKVEDSEGTFEIFENNKYQLRYYFGDEGSKVYPYYLNGDYVLQLSSKVVGESFEEWSKFFED